LLVVGWIVKLGWNAVYQLPHRHPCAGRDPVPFCAAGGAGFPPAREWRWGASNAPA